ncbi:unnamed protein product [Caenorhabditis brenneri]
MISNPTLFFVLACVVTAVTEASDLEFSQEEVRNALISEGISDSGAAEITDFLFKNRPEDITAGELKEEFREFLMKLNIKDKLSIKRIINSELKMLFSGENDGSISIC